MMQIFTRSLSWTLVLALTVLWLMLNQSLSLGHLLLGFALAVGLAWAGSTLRPVQARIRRIDVAVALLAIVLVDVIRSNFAVARVVLGLTGSKTVESGFVDVPLSIKDPHGVAALATILTATPGTVWVGLNADGTRLRVHVLDLHDPEYWVGIIQDRYECRLKRIFE